MIRGKVCSKCGEWKAFEEYSKCRARRDGCQSRCRQCSKASYQVYHTEHRNEILARKRAYYAAHKAEQNAISRAYYAEHQEEIRARARHWAKDNPEKVRDWYTEHKEEQREQTRRWRKNNPAKAKAQKHRYRARVVNAEGGYTAEEWIALCAQFKECPCCGNPWEEVGGPTVDHIVPLSWEGTRNDIDAIQPLCLTCNSRKGNRHDTDYIH